MTNKPNACYNQGSRLWLNLHSAAFKLSANPIEVMRQKYGNASFSKDEKFSNWESLMFLIFRWLGIRLSQVPTLSFPNYCHLLLQHEDHISENLVFEVWWGPFCSSVHSAIMHRGPCCQSSRNMFQLRLQNPWVPHHFSETLKKFYQKNERKILFSFIFFPVGKKRKKKSAQLKSAFRILRFLDYNGTIPFVWLHKLDCIILFIYRGSNGKRQGTAAFTSQLFHPWDVPLYQWDRNTQAILVFRPFCSVWL